MAKIIPDNLVIWVISIFAVVAIMGVVIAILFMLDKQIEQMQSTSSIQIDNVIECPDTIDKLACLQYKKNLELEIKLIELRTSRVNSSLSSRLMTSVVGEIMALALIILGATLVFARIRGEDESANLAVKEKMELSIKSKYPGVILGCAGAVTAVASMYFAAAANNSLIVIDVPVYVYDQNFSRNYEALQRAGISSKGALESRAEEQSQATQQSLQDLEAELGAVE